MIVKSKMITTRRFQKALAPLLLSLLLFVTGCATEPPSRFEQAQQESSQQRSGQAVAKDAVQGSNFNQFFPKGSNGYKRIYTQEKQGFAEAKLQREGTDVAMLSISDTISNPTAAQKFQQSSRQIASYPAVEQGNTATAVLVADRFQVKIQSRDPAFTASDRQAWLQQFDLNGLAQLQ